MHLSFTYLSALDEGDQSASKELVEMVDWISFDIRCHCIKFPILLPAFNGDIYVFFG